MIPFFSPILAGARLTDRSIASLGAMLGIAATSVVSMVVLHPAAATVALLVAPMGASAVLVFAVPASPLAQPWAVIGGNVISTLVGVAVVRLVPVPHLAAGLAVGLAILAMSLLRCLHPPGGAAALTAVIGGPAVLGAGFAFAFVPVGLNALLLAGAGLLFHRVSGHSYPHRAAPAPKGDASLEAEDIDRALGDMGETFDIAREDLDALLSRAEHHAGQRRREQRSGR